MANAAAGTETRTCAHDSSHKETRDLTIAAFRAWLYAQPVNTAAAPYNVKLNIADLGGYTPDDISLGDALRTNDTKYVNLDLSGNTPTTVSGGGIGAFDHCTNLTGVILPNSVTRIGVAAFRECTNLTSITIPNSVTSIGEMAFYGCTSLTGVTIPNGVTTIGDGAFSSCKNLTSVTIPDSLTSIGQSAFSVTSLTSITIPNSVTTIGGWAFSNCTSLTGVIIPDSVTSIGEWAFSYCESLTSVTFQGTIALSGFHNDVFYTLGDLRDKFYATDPANGTPGTYTRPDGSSETWESLKNKTNTSALSVVRNMIPIMIGFVLVGVVVIVVIFMISRIRGSRKTWTRR